MRLLKKAGYRSSCVLAAALIVAGVSLIQAQDLEGLDGTWQGAITAGPNTLRVVLEVSRSRDGIYLGTLVSIDQGGVRIPIDRIDGDGNKVRFEARTVKGSFEGTMNAEKTKISGTWTPDGRRLLVRVWRGTGALEACRRVLQPGSAPLQTRLAVCHYRESTLS